MSNNLKQIIKQEYLKCAQDPVHFMKKYCYIQHPMKGKIPFNLYDFQEKTLREVRKNRYNIILKSRQLGISTLSAGYALWLMTFHQDKNILVVATKQDTAKNLVTKVRVMHQNLPSWVKAACVEDNKLSLRYKNGSQIKAVSATEDAGRSEALSLLILDEAAFIEKADTIWTAAQQTLATGGDALILSTPNGVGNFFHKTWVGAEEGINQFNFIKLHWTVHPERDEDWRKEQDKILGPSQAAQECDCDFITSGKTVVDGKTLEWYKETFCCEPMEKRGIDGNYWIWEPPNYTKTYVVSADVARGDGGDYSALHVIDVDNLSQVAEYRGKMNTKDFGNFCVQVATEYNDALLIIENNSIGWAAIQTAIDRNYDNLFYMSKDLHYVDVQRQLTNRYRTIDKNMVAGFSMTMRTRPLVIDKLDQYFRERSLIIKSTRLVEELFTFIYHNQKAQALEGYNDDLVMALSIGLWVRDTALRLRTEGIELSKKAAGGISRSDIPIYNPSDVSKNPYEMDIGNKEKENLKWLLD